MSLAGSVAEDKYVGSRQPDDAGDQRDVYRKRKLDELLGRGDFAVPPGTTFHVGFGRQTKDLYVAWLRARVTDLLSERVVWSAVRHLARELLAQKSMDGAAVHALLESRLPRLGEEYTEEPDGARQVKYVPVRTRPAL